MSQKEVMQPTTNNSYSRPIFPYHNRVQVRFDNLLLERLYLIGHFEDEFHFLSTRVQVSVSIKAAREANI